MAAILLLNFKLEENWGDINFHTIITSRGVKCQVSVENRVVFGLFLLYSLGYLELFLDCRYDLSRHLALTWST